MDIATAIALAVLVPPAAPPESVGMFVGIRPDGKEAVPFALKNTEVRADVDGFGAAVTVTQTFRNPNSVPIEAIYTFPLPQNAAVDGMRIEVGSRIIEGEIARREEARRTYETARAAGQTAALLDQERPDVFTQSVANLMPGHEVKVQIHYVQTLDYREGQYEFSFPMVVGPRYTDRNTPDPGKISPPIVPKGTRSGAGIDLRVNVNGGAELLDVTSVLHEVDVRRSGPTTTMVSLRRRDEIPNRDFILRYRTADKLVSTGFVSHFEAGEGGTFAVYLMPPKSAPATGVRPKEMIFVMDQSGSQRGFPMEKSKELTLKLLRRMGPQDAFNVLGFNVDVNPLWPAPRPNNPQNLAAAERFINAMEANGGTQLEKAVTAVGEMPPDPERLRMVVFNTDGYAGQDRVNLDEVRRYRDTSRMFVFGIGNSVNRYLIDAMATEGRGDREIVTLAEGADDAVDRLYRRTDSPILTDLTAEIEGAKDLTPAHLPDVFLERPVILMGRYDRPGPATVTLRGTMADGTIWTRQLDLRLTNRPEAPALPSLWARRRIDDLLTERFFSAAKPMEQPNMEPVIQLALSHGIMSEFTSFVAVEKRVVNVGGRQRTVRVPVEMADGVSYDGIFGLREERIQGIPNALSTAALGAPMVRAGRGLPAAGSAEVQDRAKQALPDPEVQYRAKIAEKLRRAQGKVEVQITLTSWSEETLAKLERAGLKIDAREKTLKAVFGTVDASKLRELARVDEVDRILPLEG